MALTRHTILAVLALALAGCGGGGSPTPVAPPPGGGQGAPVSQTLSVLPATKAPNPGAIVMLRADPRSVVNITFQWTSDCTDGAFYSPTVTAGNQTTLGVVWFQLPSTASRTCQVLVTATSPGITWSGNTTVTTRPVISTNWLSFHSDPANTGRTTEFDLGPTPGTLGQVWKVSGGNVSTVAPALSLQGGVGRVILGDLDGVVRSFAATDGSLSWTTTLGDRLVGNPIIGDGNVMVATAFGAVKALDLATGNELWSVNVGNQVEAVPAYAFGVLVVGSIGGSVHGVATGRTISSSLDRLMWTTQVSGRIIGSLSVFDGVLGGSPSLSNLYDAVAFLGTDQGFFYAIRVADGEILNQWQLGSRIVTAPAVFMMGADPAVAVATEDGKLFVFSAQAPFGSLVTSPDGVLYTSNSPVTSAPVFHDGNLFFFLRDNRAISFDPITESLTFSQFLPSASPDSENLVCTNTPGVALSSTDVPYLYLSCFELFVGGDPLFPFVTARGLLVILSENTITGQIEELGRYAVGTFQFEGASYTPGDAVISPPVVMGGMVYLTSQDGSLYALGPVPVFDFTGGPSLWPAKRGDPTGTGFFGTGPGLGILQEKWSFQMPGRVTASPALAGDTLWIGDLDGNLVGLRAGDGLHRFTWGGFNELGATPILMDDNLVFIHGLSGVGDLLAVDGDRLTLVGRVRTIFTDRLERDEGGGGLSDILERMRQITSLSPAYDEQTRTLFVPMVNNCSFTNNAFDRCEGQHWDLSTGDRTDDLMIGVFDLSDPDNISMTPLDPGHSLDARQSFTTSFGIYRHSGISYLVVGFDNGFGNGNLLAWDVTNPSSPTQIWGGSTVNLGSGAVPRGVPSFVENFVVIGTLAGNVQVIDLTADTVPTPEKLTLSPSPIDNSLAVSYDAGTGEGMIFAPLFEGGLAAQPFSIVSGAFSYGSSILPWQRSTNDFVRSAPGVDLESGVVYIGSDDGNVYRFEHDSGFSLAGTFLARGPVLSSPMIVGGYLFVIDYTGRITALAP